MNLLHKSREVLLGTLKIHPAKLIPGTGESVDGLYIKAKYEPRKRELILDGRKGQLLGFSVEGEQEETYCFGLIQFPDGTFDTLAVECFQLVDTTPINLNMSDNDSAFPSSPADIGYERLTIRGEFAARAMVAILTNQQLLIITLKNSSPEQISATTVARESIIMADALILELNKPI